MLPVNEKDLAFAIQAVHRAALLASQVQAELVRAQPLTKADASPVTVADYAAQALIAHLLSESFPDDPVVAEEESQELTDEGSHKTLEQVARFVQHYAPGADPKAVAAWIDYNRVDSAPRFWTIDPIDGTKGFLRGEQYAVALALVEGGQVQIGVLGCPNLVDASHPELGGPGSLIVAKRGRGAWVTALQAPGEYRPLRASDARDPAGARILRSVEAGHTNASQVDRFAQAMQATSIAVDSQAKYGMLAAGAGEVVLRLLSPTKPDYKEKIWDQAAGSLILEEAGGKVTDLHGKPLDFTRGRTLAGNRGILATNGHLHPVALSILEQIQA